MPADYSVTVIVLNWNGRDLLKDCLESLGKVTYPNYNILVVDNGSSDESVSYVQSEFPNVDLLILEQNYGYAKGNNRGFDYANSHGAECVVFLNNDTIVDPKFLDELVKAFENPAIGMSTAKIFYADEPNKIWFNGADINLSIGKIEHRNIREMNTENLKTIEFTDYATGCCLAIKSDVFADVNGFDEKFPMYAEDVDLSIRVKQSGREIAMAPKAHIWHKVSSSMGGEFSYNKLKRKFTGLLRVYIKHATLFEWVSVIALSPVLIAINMLRFLTLKFHHSSSE
jgi:hypothetical protein